MKSHDNQAFVDQEINVQYQEAQTQMHVTHLPTG